MKTIFHCPQCDQAVTRPLEPLPAGKEICHTDGLPAVPEGYFAASVDDYWTGSVGCTLVNLQDLVGTRYHPFASRNNGCCGRDGVSGPNLLCAAGHEIGTERSDCWMAHAAVLIAAVKKAIVEG